MTKPSRPSKQRLSPLVMRLAERVEQLTRTQQRFVIKIVDVLTEHNQP
jgi:hypothetical protein